MHIRKAIIKNYKQFENLEILFDSSINIIVGNNETGKTTLFEALNLALTCKINNRPLYQELSPYLFNDDVVKRYVENLKSNPQTPLPEILIEVYFNDDDNLAKLKGTYNSQKENCIGVSLKIKFDNCYQDEYIKYIEDVDKVTTIPIEYYTCEWYTFASQSIKFTYLPVRALLIDNVEHHFTNGPDQYVSQIIESALEKKENALLALKYRKLKEDFTLDDNIKKINQKIIELNDAITDKNLQISLDISSKTSWDANLSLYLNDIPFKFSGKGEQNSIKTKLALKIKNDKSNIIFIEEPETNLSYSKMCQLVKYIEDHCLEKQVFISTHNSFIMNKTGIDKTIILSNKTPLKLNELKPDTYEYFKKLPGYDTLRLILSEKTFLVEGPSDELIVQKSYLDKYGKLPIEDGIDVITVRGLSFLRFLEIADKLKKAVIVFTDNDGNYKKLEKNIKIIVLIQR